MISAEWLFMNHESHVAMMKLLTIQLGSEAEEWELSDEERDEEIEALVLSRPAFDGMPRGKGYGGSSTERAVMHLANEGRYSQKEELRRQLAMYHYLLKLFDSIRKIVSERERWFIDWYYVKGCSLTDILLEEGSPFSDISKTTLWKYKQKLLEKADDLLVQLWRCMA